MLFSLLFIDTYQFWNYRSSVTTVLCFHSSGRCLSCKLQLILRFMLVLRSGMVWKYATYRIYVQFVILQHVIIDSTFGLSHFSEKIPCSSYGGRFVFCTAFIWMKGCCEVCPSHLFSLFVPLYRSRHDSIPLVVFVLKYTTQNNRFLDINNMSSPMII